MHRSENQEQEVAAVGDLSREELVARWVKAYRCPPPKGLKRGLLERAAAWQLQAKTHGGLSPDAKRLLKAARRQFESALKRPRRSRQLLTGVQANAVVTCAQPEHERHAASDWSAATGASVSDLGRPLAGEAGCPRLGPPSAPRNPLRSGTRLLREWNGQQHFVEVVDDGFVFDGKEYRSLSAIARTITGAHWSGPRFFGL